MVTWIVADTETWCRFNSVSRAHMSRVVCKNVWPTMDTVVSHSSIRRRDGFEWTTFVHYPSLYQKNGHILETCFIGCSFFVLDLANQTASIEHSFILHLYEHTVSTAKSAWLWEFPKTSNISMLEVHIHCEQWDKLPLELSICLPIKPRMTIRWNPKFFRHCLFANIL